MNIVYANDSGSVAIIYPTSEALSLLTLDEIAQRLVPEGLKYWIVDPSVIPADRTYRDAWVFDESLIGESA